MLQTQVVALARLQDADGMFHTLLDDPTSPVEASATAGIGYGVLRYLSNHPSVYITSITFRKVNANVIQIW